MALNDRQEEWLNRLKSPDVGMANERVGIYISYPSMMFNSRRQFILNVLSCDVDTFKAFFFSSENARFKADARSLLEKCMRVANGEVDRDLAWVPPLDELLDYLPQEKRELIYTVVSFSLEGKMELFESQIDKGNVFIEDGHFARASTPGKRIIYISEVLKQCRSARDSIRDCLISDINTARLRETMFEYANDLDSRGKRLVNSAIISTGSDHNERTKLTAWLEVLNSLDEIAPQQGIVSSLRGGLFTSQRVEERVQEKNAIKVLLHEIIIERCKGNIPIQEKLDDLVMRVERLREEGSSSRVIQMFDAYIQSDPDVAAMIEREEKRNDSPGEFELKSLK